MEKYDVGVEIWLIQLTYAMLTKNAKNEGAEFNTSVANILSKDTFPNIKQ